LSEMINVMIWHPNHVFTLDIRRRDLATIRKLGRKIAQDIAAHDQAGTYETMYLWLDRATDEQYGNDAFIALGLAIIEDREPHADVSDHLVLRFVPQTGDGPYDVMVTALNREVTASTEQKLAMMRAFSEDYIKHNADLDNADLDAATDAA
jgi:hypothetical protein